MFADHIAAINKELTYAVGKHPHFADRFASSTTTLPTVENLLAVAHAKSDAEGKSGDSFETTINEEVLESLEAYLKNDLDHAYQELAQCGAVILRAMEWVDTKRNQNGQA